MTDSLLYSDSLVEITDNAICFKNYHFPTSAKSVLFSDIESVTTAKNNFWNGKYRIHGTGDLQTWFPRDWHRPSRSKIFFAALCGSSERVGFTVEAADQVEAILRRKKLLSGPEQNDKKQTTL